MNIVGFLGYIILVAASALAVGFCLGFVHSLVMSTIEWNGGVCKKTGVRWNYFMTDRSVEYVSQNIGLYEKMYVDKFRL